MWTCRICLGEFVCRESMYWVAPNGHGASQPTCRDCHEREVLREVREEVVMRPLTSSQVHLEGCLFALIRSAHDLEFAEERKRAMTAQQRVRYRKRKARRARMHIA